MGREGVTCLVMSMALKLHRYLHSSISYFSSVQFISKRKTSLWAKCWPVIRFFLTDRRTASTVLESLWEKRKRRVVSKADKDLLLAVRDFSHEAACLHVCVLKFLLLGVCSIMQQIRRISLFYSRYSVSISSLLSNQENDIMLVSADQSLKLLIY